MIIDDDEPTNFISSLIIDEAGCSNHLEVVDSGNKALQYLKNAVASTDTAGQFIMPDLIFLDINMPRMNGWEFLQEYSKLSFLPLSQPVIIMMTTSYNPEDRIKADKIREVAGYENKPLTLEIIDTVLEKYFNPHTA